MSEDCQRPKTPRRGNVLFQISAFVYDLPHSQILLCDSCDSGYHTACLRPPLMLIPDGEWFCPPCQHVSCMCATDNPEVTRTRLISRNLTRTQFLASVGDE